MKRVRWSPSASPAANARKVLPRLAHRFYKTGRKAIASTDGDVLHDFRLATKRLRYTLEFFEPVYGPGLAARMATLKELQRYLGEITDAHVSEVLLSSGPTKNRAEVRRVLIWLGRHAGAEKSGLRRYWRTAVDTDGAEERWINYLKRYARG